MEIHAQQPQVVGVSNSQTSGLFGSATFLHVSSVPSPNISSHRLGSARLRGSGDADEVEGGAQGAAPQAGGPGSETRDPKPGGATRVLPKP